MPNENTQVASKNFLSLAILGARWLGLLFLCIGLWLLTANLIEALADLTNFQYPLHLFLQSFLRPVLAIILAILLWLLSGPLGRRLSSGLEE